MSSVASDFARALDPAAVFREGVRNDVGRQIDPAQWQVEVMASDARRQLILCNRQAGKSTTIGAKCARGMVYEPGLYLCIAPVLRQSKLLFKKTREIYSRLEDVPRIVRDTETELELENGSMMVALPGDNDATIRGYSAPRAVYIDEADAAALGGVEGTPVRLAGQGRYAPLLLRAHAPCPAPVSPTANHYPCP